MSEGGTEVERGDGGKMSRENRGTLVAKTRKEEQLRTRITKQR